MRRRLAQLGRAGARRVTNRPWQVLVIAAFFLLPAAFFLCSNLPTRVTIHSGSRSLRREAAFIAAQPSPPQEILSPGVIHGLGIIAALIGMGFVALYFYLRRTVEFDRGLHQRRWR